MRARSEGESEDGGGSSNRDEVSSTSPDVSGLRLFNPYHCAVTSALVTVSEEVSEALLEHVGVETQVSLTALALAGQEAGAHNLPTKPCGVSIEGVV